MRTNIEYYNAKLLESRLCMWRSALWITRKSLKTNMEIPRSYWLQAPRIHKKQPITIVMGCHIPITSLCHRLVEKVRSGIVRIWYCNTKQATPTQVSISQYKFGMLHAVEAITPIYSSDILM